MTTIPLQDPDPVARAPDPEVLLRRLTASLAHNVNNALAGVIGYLELALEQPDRPPDANDRVRSALGCAHQAADAVRRIVGCSRRIAEAEPRAPHSLRRLAQEAAARLGGAATVTGACAGQVFVSAGLVGLALDALLRALASADVGRITLRPAEEDGGCVLYAEGAEDGGADLQLRLLEASLMTEIQGGALEVLSAAGRPASIRMWFPGVGRPPLRRDDAQAGPPAPHLAAPLGLLRPAV